MSATPRERAAAAFAEIDAIDRMESLRYVGLESGRKDRAFALLARAMDDEFGPLDGNDIGIITVARWEGE